MSKQVATFVWDRVTYTIPADSQYRNILLSNGVVLVYDGFQHSNSILVIEPASAGFSIIIAPGEDPSVIAIQLRAVLATELGYCPDHPDEHGNFCRECGRPIHQPTPLAPKPPFPFQTTISKHNFHLTVPVDVMGSGPCPNCKQPLDHNAHTNSCPRCGQSLHWTCRSAE